MASSTRSKRGEVAVSSPSQQSDVEDPGSDSDYSPGSLIIDIGTEEVMSSAQSSSPVVVRPSPSPSSPSPSSSNRGRRSVARRQYNTPSNRMVFTGVSLRGQISVIQTGHSQAVDRLDLYAFGWGDFYLDIVSRRTHSFIPVRNIYEKVIPGLKRNVLSARISKLQVKSEALTEPYISSMKKLGLVVTGASHFVGITDFVKICQYFHVEPPGILAKFCNITSEIDPEAILRSFSTDQTSNQTIGSLTGDDSVNRSTIGQSAGITSSLLGGGEGGGERPSSRGSVVSGDVSASPHNTTEEVDIRRLALADGAGVTVVVRGGEPYLLKVELPSILPSHSREVLETIRRTYGIMVFHASKAEIGLLKAKGVVGSKAGRCALFSARDVCRMFHHWKSPPPPPLTELANGKLPTERLDSTTDATFPPSYPISSYGFALEDLPSFPNVPTTLPHSSSTSFTPSQHPPPPFSTLQPPPHYTQPTSHVAPRLSHPPSITSSPFPISSLSADQFQQPIQILNSLQSTRPSLPQFPPPSQPPFSTTSHYPLPTQSHALFSTSSHPPYPPQPHHQPSNFTGNVVGMPPPNYPVMGLNPVAGDGASKPLVVSSVDYLRTPVKMESGGGGGRKRSLSTTGPPLDDQELDYVPMVWGEHQLTLVCPPANAEPFLAIPELVDKIFHNRAHVSTQRRSELGITTLPATSLQMHILRAKGSLDAFTGNAKLVCLSGAVKLAAISNIQIPGTVIRMIRKYCQEPLESIITPAGFTPATHPPSSQSSYYSPSPSHSSPSLHSHSSHPHSSQQSSHSELPPQESGSSYPTGVTTRVKDGVTKSEAKGTPPSTTRVTSSKEDSAASVSPHDGVPQHPDLIDPGSSFTSTVDGTYCLVKWGANRLALLIGSQRVHYMGLYQIFQALFKQYVTRMNFKMRMRKLEIKSIRAASSVRQALINLDALPQSSPVCGLIRVSEVERLARSYGIEPPQVLYDVFLLRHSDQKKLPNYTRSSAGRALAEGGGGKNSSGVAARSLSQSGQGSQEVWSATQMLMREQAALMQSLPFGGRMNSGRSDYTTSQTSLPSSTHSMVITTAVGDKDALTVSVPRQALTSRFRLVSRPVAPPGLMTGFHSSSSSSRPSYPPLPPHGLVLHSLARKISQKSRKLGKGKTSGVGAVRSCPKCNYVNPASKKRCGGCEEFIVGRHCPSCGTLNHNRTRECFRCNAVIEESEGMRYRAGGASEDSLSPESPLSPHFSPPPIRNAALKSMFPQDSGKSEDSGVVTKTMFSGNLSSSRKCVECGQLNSKMAKKCLQCKSPLQGRPCPQCNRPNHSHSTECYKCGHSLPCTATKWVYVGSSSNKIYRSQESNSSSRISAGLKNRATRVCLRCNRLRNNGRFTCGRCGDMYWTKPVVGGANDVMDTPTSGSGTQGHYSKRKRAGLEPNWNNIPSEPDVEEMVSFASNLLCLDIGEGLLSLVNEAETKARETVHQAEEELEGVEEEYQACAGRREEKEGVLNNARAELEALIAEVDRSTKRLSELQREEENAKTITNSHPDTISQLREKIECALRILTTSATTTSTITSTTVASPTGAGSSEGLVLTSEDPAPSDAVEKMDSSDH